MFSFFNYKIDIRQIPIFLSLYLFSITFIYILIDGFISNDELFDFIFLTIAFIFIEILFFIFFKKIFNWKVENKKNIFFLIIISVFFYLIWNQNILYSYVDLILYISFFLISSFAIKFLVIKYKFANHDYNEINFFNLIFIFSIFLSALLYEINFSNINKLLLYFPSFFLLILLVIFFKKIHKSIDIFFSIIFFLIFFKVFLISSEKDAFHYAWYLGPVNSLFNYELYKEVVSQYGFLNILAIFKLTKFTNISSSVAIVIFIIFLISIFFIMFIKNLSKAINLPFSILTIFSCLIVFGSIGYADLTSSIFIPSSSVLRFLPSIISIILFARLANENINIINLASFCISCLISFLWSFESFFFTCFPILVFLFFKFNSLIFVNYYSKPSNIDKKNFLTILFILLLIFCISLFILIYENNLLSFYEYALLTNTSLSEKITNNEFTLLFIFIIFISYLFLRNSFDNKKFFYHNLLFFSLLISF